MFEAHSELVLEYLLEHLLGVLLQEPQLELYLLLQLVKQRHDRLVSR